MAIQLKKIAESPTTYAAYKALMEQWQGLFGNQNAVFANDGTTEVPEDAKNKIATIKVFDKDDKAIGYSKTYSDENAAQAQEETWYKVTLDGADKDTLEKDLKTVKFCFWVQNPKGETLVIEGSKKAIMITVKGNASSSDSTTDILEPKNTETLTKNLAKAYHYAKIEYTKEEAILKIKWSKWLDRHFVRVETYQKQINIKVDGGNTTASRYVKAQPEIIKGYWTNDNKDTITNKIVGYKDTVYMCLKTLGMQDKNLALELWEDDYGYGDEQIEIENTAFEITNRYTYKKLELPEKTDDDYQKQRGGSEGNQLELYFKLPQEKETEGYKSGYAKNLKLITHEKLTEAYFAKEEKREQIQDSTLPEAEQTPTTHAVRPNPRETITDVATQYGLDAQELATLNSVTLTENLTYGTSVQLKSPAQIAADKKAKAARNKKQEAAKTEPSYQRIESASLGSEVWLVIESANLQGKTASVQIFDNEELLEDSNDTAITILKGDAEVTKLDNLKFDDEGIAKVKIKLRKKSDEDYKKQKDKFKDDKIAKLFLKVKCKGEDDEHKIKFLDGEEFEIKFSCFCNRDLTEEEVKDIVIAMRKSETSVYTGGNKEKLFFKSNCPLPASDKTYAKFTEELNKTFKSYDIDTCMRRMHFLAQVYHETDRFRTTKEYSTSGSYAPYIGRGLMQLTWESNYIKYKSYSGVDCVTDYEKVASNLFHSFNSAGWFWKQGKTLSVGTTWSPPSSAPSYVTAYNAGSYSKTTITYDNNGTSSTYGTIDLNLLADDDYVDIISWLVNGGSNGLQERRDYLKELKDVFKYESNCENK